MTAQRRRYYMYPQKTYAGYVETEVLSDGRIKYYIYMAGWDQPNELVVDPCNENDMRGVRQLHLIMNESLEEKKDGDQDYMISGDNVEAVLDAIRGMFRKVDES